jgi:hypothetical protein
MCDQKMHHLADRAQSRKQSEYQPDRRLRLRVGIEHGGDGCTANLARK